MSYVLTLLLHRVFERLEVATLRGQSGTLRGQVLTLISQLFVLPMQLISLCDDRFLQRVDSALEGYYKLVLLLHCLLQLRQLPVPIGQIALDQNVFVSQASKTFGIANIEQKIERVHSHVARGKTLEEDSLRIN